MWVLLKDGKYGKVTEIVDLNEIELSKTELENKLVDAQLDFSNLSVKIDSVKDTILKDLLGKSLEDATAPIVMISKDIQDIQAKIDEINSI